MPARTLGGIARSSQSAIPVLRAAQCDVAIGSHITYSRASAGTRYNSAGLLATMASGVPRIDYDPVSLAVRGLLIEEQRSNLLTYSEQFDNAAWVSGFATVTANSEVSPAGTTSADKLAETSDNSFHYLYQATTVGGGASLCLSAFAKAAGRDWAILQAYDGVAYPNAYVNLTTGALGAVTSGVATIETAGAGMRRCSIRYTMAAGTASFVYLLTALGNLMPTFAGDVTKGLAAWGGMLEAATADYPHATSYIPTVAAQATRAADDATITGDAFTALYNAAAWGAFLRFRLTNAVGTRPVLSFDDNTANNRIEVYASGTSLKLRVVTGGAQQCDTTIGTVAANTDYKLAISQDGGAFLCTLNGAAEVSASAASMPTVDRARLGRNQAGNYLNGHLHTWDAYRRAVPVRERLELTA